MALALLAFASWEGVQGRFSTASHASILATIAAVFIVALASGHGLQRRTSRAWARGVAQTPGRLLFGVREGSTAALGALVWATLIGATIVWDVVSFVAQRHSFPTLSRLFGDVTDHEWGRGLVFALWLALGLYLARGWRRSPSGSDVG